MLVYDLIEVRDDRWGPACRLRPAIPHGKAPLRKLLPLLLDRPWSWLVGFDRN